jgi:hypothetical protein
MSYPDHLAPLFKATQRLDGGIVVLDRSWRIVYSNSIIREIYPGFAFLSDASGIPSFLRMAGVHPDA